MTPLRAFMIPGVFGADVQLADLSRRLRSVLTMDVLSLPDVHASGRVLTDMAATGRGLVEDIVRRQPRGPIALMGFSFGASMALEVAGQLERAGRKVSFLVILDGPLEPPEPTSPQLAPPRGVASRKLVKPLIWKVVESTNVARRFILSVAAKRDPGVDRVEPLRRGMLWHLRNRALKRWDPPRCNASGVLVSTGTYGERNSARWAELCPNLEHFRVTADHEDLLKRDALNSVVSHLKVALRVRYA